MAGSVAKPFETPEWRQVRPDEDKFLEFLLADRESFSARFEKATAYLLELPPDLLLTYLPMILAHMDEGAASMKDMQMFEVACEFVKAIFCRYRPTKMRFIALCQLGKHHKLWDLTLEQRVDAYPRNERHLSAMEEKLGAIYSTLVAKESLRVEESADLNLSSAGLLDSEVALRRWVDKVFLHPVEGIRRESHVVGLREVHESFSEEQAVLFVIGACRESASAARKICARMVELGLIIKSTFFPDHEEFGFGKNYYQSSECASSDFGTHNVIREGTSMRPKDKNFQLADYIIELVKIQTTIYVDQMDLQNLSFWTRSIWMKPLKEDDDFGMIKVMHPLKAITAMDVKDVEEFRASEALYENVEESGVVGTRVFVNKVFSSLARPGIVSVQVAPEASIVEIDEEGFICRDYKALEPNLLVKAGDNLMQDMNVEIMFRVFNYIWRTDDVNFPDPDKAPFSYAYDILPTGIVQGVMEVLTNVKPLNHYQWDDWAKDYGQKPEVADLMLRSAAGSFIAAYVVGAGDRHWDNILIKDSSMLLHIDFGFVMGAKAPLEGPRFAISPEMEKAFVAVGIWEPFLDLCGKAFLSLRNKGALITREIYGLFRHTGLTHAECVKYLASKESFHMNAKSDDEACEFVRKRVETASRKWTAFMRAYAHDHVDPLYYQMLEKKFTAALLVDAIMQKEKDEKNAKAMGKEQPKGMKKFRRDLENGIDQIADLAKRK